MRSLNPRASRRVAVNGRRSPSAASASAAAEPAPPATAFSSVRRGNLDVFSDLPACKSLIASLPCEPVAGSYREINSGAAHRETINGSGQPWKACVSSASLNRSMEMMQWFERRKQWCEEQLRLAETDPNFRLLRRTHGGGQIDLTETHKKDLRDARDEYQRVIDRLKAK
jgi:hypothetical protein